MHLYIRQAKEEDTAHTVMPSATCGSDLVSNPNVRFIPQNTIRSRIHEHVAFRIPYVNGHHPLFTQ